MENGNIYCMDVFSFSPFGYEGSIVKVEVDLRRGIPAITMVGLPDSAVRESRERMRAAIRNSNLEFPKERILINLSPADVKKAGVAFDLAVALAVLIADVNRDEPNGRHRGQEPSQASIPNCILIMGELELSGYIRSVQGITAALSTAHENGIFHCIIPSGNATEAVCIPHMCVHSVNTLIEAFHCIQNIMHGTDLEDHVQCDEQNALYKRKNETHPFFAPVVSSEDFALIENQPRLIRALQIAVAGSHNVLIFGPPGCGKTLAVNCIPSLLPQLDEEQFHTVSRIYSVSSQTSTTYQHPSYAPPFRKPHQSASVEGMIGGGTLCAPGEISLAHHGILFLDEACEFRSSVLQSLRIPLETGIIHLSRAGRSTCFPADFQLIMATNPCPCGNFGSSHSICTCDPHRIDTYWKKFSSPLLDRIDIRVPVQQPDFSQNEKPDIQLSRQNISSSELRIGVQNAVLRQKKRGIRNRHLNASSIYRVCSLAQAEQVLFRHIIDTLHFSARSSHSILKIARTIADIEDSDRIREEHILEAVQHRRWGNTPWETRGSM